MAIGISACWDFLAGKNEKEESQITLESFDSVESYLRLVKDLGVTSIELRKFDTGLAGHVTNICNKLKTNQFSVTVHGQMTENNLDADLYSTFPWLKEVCGIFDDRPLIIVVHPIEGVERTQAEYRDATVEKLKRIAGAIERDGLNVKIALEINQFKEKKTSPGYTYEGVLDMVTAVNSDRLGICFDFGHTGANIRRGIIAKTIPDEFLHWVIHTHIHDLSPVYQTHWPLTFGHTPVGEYVKLLTDRGYDGVFNLELAYDRFRTEFTAKEAIVPSLKRLGDILKKI